MTNAVHSWVVGYVSTSVGQVVAIQVWLLVIQIIIGLAVLLVAWRVHVAVGLVIRAETAVDTMDKAGDMLFRFVKRVEENAQLRVQAPTALHRPLGEPPRLPQPAVPQQPDPPLSSILVQ